MKAKKLSQRQEKREKELDLAYIEAINEVGTKHNRTLVAILNPSISSITSKLEVVRVPKDKKVLETK